jgi:hypothetical protein
MKIKENNYHSENIECVGIFKLIYDNIVDRSTFLCLNKKNIFRNFQFFVVSRKNNIENLIQLLDHEK